MNASVKKQVHWDEGAFFIGVMNIIVSSWLVGAYPHTFWIYYWISIFVFLVIQFVQSIPKRQQFWMLELCYVVNYFFLLFFILVLAHACPWPSTVFRVLFSFCVGPLAMSIFMTQINWSFYHFKRGYMGTSMVS